MILLLAAFEAESQPRTCDEASAWTEPVNLGPVVNSSFLEQNATLSADELSLYFISNRPGVGANDIWVSRRACHACPWEAPVNVAPLNTAFAEGGPSLSPDGRMIFFHSDRLNPLPGGRGNDIWVSRRADPNDDLGWEEPQLLGDDVNTPEFGEFSPEYVQHADVYAQSTARRHANAALYFGRGPDGNNQDIWTVPISRDGETLGPAVRVTELSSAAGDAAPTLRKDGKEILFWSLREGGFGFADIWVATRQNTHEKWSLPENVGPPVSTEANEVTANLSHNGRTLLFASNRLGGFGSQDIWMSTRRPGCR